MTKEYTVYFSLNATETITASSEKEAYDLADQLIKNKYHATLLASHQKDFFIEVFDVELD